MRVSTTTDTMCRTYGDAEGLRRIGVPTLPAAPSHAARMTMKKRPRRVRKAAGKLQKRVAFRKCLCYNT